MKTMMSVDGKSIIRVSDEKASKLFEEGFRYVSKSMWKEKVRDVNKEEKTTKKKTKKKVRKVK
tara:strand:- start:609 stop:797 length:189 start_codon:yes stop_codon:yes gene_type:complete